MHGLANRHTGPTGGVCSSHVTCDYTHGAGYFYFAGGRGELDRDAGPGSEYVLSYDGSTCMGYGLIGRVGFFYHMWGSAMGTLRLEAIEEPGGAPSILWSLSGDQGDVWRYASLDVSCRALQFRYIRASTEMADAAIAEVNISCNLAPPPRPPAPPLTPPLPPLPPMPPTSPPSPLPPLPPAEPPLNIFGDEYAGVWVAAMFAVCALTACSVDLCFEPLCSCCALCARICGGGAEAAADGHRGSQSGRLSYEVL
jgi:hypothetical protein